MYLLEARWKKLDFERLSSKGVSVLVQKYMQAKVGKVMKHSENNKTITASVTLVT